MVSRCVLWGILCITESATALKADAALAEIISGTPQKVFEVKEKNFSHVELY